MITIVGHVAMIVAAMFTGAAVYILWAEQPARLALDDRALLAQWQPSYSRGYVMQSSLAVIGFLLGATAWWLSREVFWIAGAVAMILNWPWTLVVMKPVNARLDAWAIEQADTESRRLIQRWAALHAVRAVLGGLAVLAFFLASLAPY